MRRIAYSFLVLFGILLGTAFIVPFFFNINDYKPQIVAKAKNALGRDVIIDGELSLSFLPSPQLIIDKVRVTNDGGHISKDFLSIKRIRLSFRLLPLLRKHLKITTLELDQPEIFLEKLKGDRTNWTLPSPSASSSPSPSSNFEINFDKVMITNGQLIYQSHEESKTQTPGQEIKIHNINTQAKIARLEGPYEITGTFTAFDQDIKLEGKIGALGETQDVNLKIQVGETASTLIGKIASLPLTFKGEVTAVADPKLFQTYFTKDNVSPSPSGEFRVKAEVVASQDGIIFRQAQFDVGTAHPTGDLTISLKGGLQIGGDLKNLPGGTQCRFALLPSPQGFQGTIKSTVNHAKELLTWLKIDTNRMPPEMLGALTFSTNYSIGKTIEESTQLKGFTLMIGGAHLHGDASWVQQKSGPSVAVNLETPKFENILKLIGVKGPKRFGASKLIGNLHVGTTAFNLTNLKGKLGSNLSFEGDVMVDHKDIKPKIKATLTLNSINIDTLLASRQLENSQFTEGRIHLISAKSPTHHPSSVSKWSHEAVDLTFLQKFDGQFEISSSQLNHKDIVIDHPKLSAKVQNDQLEISSLTGSIYGGTFRLSGHLTADNALNFHILIQDANLKQLFAHGSTIKIVAGKLTFSSEVSTHGKSLAEMIQHLAGPVIITAKDGVINGFDLHTLSQRLGNLQNLQSVLGLLNTSMGKGQTSFSSFKGDIVFHEGVGKIQSMSLTAPDAQGQASGQIDLPNYSVDIHSEFRLTAHPKLPPFYMSLKGPIDNPSRKLDTSELQKYLTENVFKGMIGKLGKGISKPADMLGSLLGGGNSSDKGDQPAPQQDNGGALDKPEQVVKKIFKGIF